MKAKNKINKLKKQKLPEKQMRKIKGGDSTSENFDQKANQLFEII